MMREWKESMGEISGFGGGYEAVCRAMVLAGIHWCDENPDADPRVRTAEEIFGIAIEDNGDAQALTAAMMDAPVYFNGKLIQKRVGEDCTGAMHHAAMNHVFAYRRLSWDGYVRELEKHTAERGARG